MRRTFMLQAAVLAGLVAGHPVLANDCGCSQAGAWTGGGYSPLHQSAPGVSVTLTGGGSFWELTLKAAGGTRQLALPGPPGYDFNDSFTRFVVGYSNGGVETEDVYALDQPGIPLLVQVAGTGLSTFNFSMLGNFMTYSQQFPGQVLHHVLRTDTGAEIYSYSVPNPSGPPGFPSMPIFAPDDRSFYYEIKTDSPQQISVISTESQGMTWTGFFPSFINTRYSPCGDLIAVEADGAYELHSVKNGGAAGLFTIPTGMSFWTGLMTSATEHYVEYNDLGGFHHVHVADNTASLACPVTIQPATVTPSPSSVLGGLSVTATVTLNGPAPVGGVAVQVDASPPGLFTPSSPSFVIPWGASVGSTTFQTHVITGVPQTATFTVAGTVPPVTAQITVNPAPAQLTAFAIEPLPVPSGDLATMFFNLSDVALDTGADIALTSSDTASFPVPAVVTVPPLHDRLDVQVQTRPSAINHTVVLQASYLGVVITQTVMVRGPQPAYFASQDGCVIGGQPIHAMLDLTPASPPGGINVAVGSSNPALVPPPGAFHFDDGVARRTFDVPTGSVSTPTDVTLFTGINGVNRQFVVTIEPAQTSWVNLIAPLDPEGSYPSSVAEGVNDFGAVVGRSSNSFSDGSPFRWQSGTLEALPELSFGGPVDAAARAINNMGVVVGACGPDAFRYDGKQIVDLTPGVGGAANAVNTLGKVAGWIGTAQGQRAFFYDGTMHTLGTLGGPSSQANGINASDVVVGSSEVTPGVTHAFRWTQTGGMQDLGLPPGMTEAFAMAINRVGVVVGYARDASFHQYACKWDPSGPQLLDSNQSQALSINDANQIVGRSVNNALLWSGGTRTVLDAMPGSCGLADLASMLGSGSFLEATGINNRGQICGFGESEVNDVAWLLTMPPPTIADTPPVAPDAPRGLGVSVLGANPLRGRLVLRCSLPRLAPARLELLDVSGRRVASRVLSGEATLHLVALPEADALAPGVYFARLEQAGQSRFARVVVLR